MIQQPGGIAVSDEVLQTIRFTNVFIRQKPPVQYTISVLIQNIFSLFPPPYGADRREYEVSLDLIYQKANLLFPPWWESDVQTVQVKRGWIKEALDTMVNLKLIKRIPQKLDSYLIPIPTLISRKPMEEVICRKIKSLEKTLRSRGRPPAVRRVPKKRPPEVGPLSKYL
jgi:hypothetical protein